MQRMALLSKTKIDETPCMAKVSSVQYIYLLAKEIKPKTTSDWWTAQLLLRFPSAHLSLCKH